ncbi:TPM domain-containing protein [Brevundimonas sp. 2R-24]|uniref:TPM domain-containing protein n=1 Tax=Peiella sedimenti TaxID=3061083 RepID=A0ABT8SMH1_9CAUL|nr:TPM domain-containing protein [Caulobacteraceae bacterium XZ-24]
MVSLLNPGEHLRISSAIKAAEARTSGEIFCVLARRVASHEDVALLWAAGLALALPMLLIPLGLVDGLPGRLLPGLSGGWTAGHMSATPSLIAATLGVYALLQTVIFFFVWGLSLIPAVRRLMVPAAVRRARVRDAALAQFLSHGIHQTQGRTGVLILVSVFDRDIEIVADEEIHEKVGPEVWGRAVEGFAIEARHGRWAEGFIRAIGGCGQVLSEHFPAERLNPNELPDHLVEM